MPIVSVIQQAGRGYQCALKYIITVRNRDNVCVEHRQSTKRYYTVLAFLGRVDTTSMYTPGPGTYGPAATARAVIPKWRYFAVTTPDSIGKEQRGQLYRTYASPGPGAYEPKTVRTLAPKYGFAGRHSASASHLTPGPGQYTPDYKQKTPLTTYKFTMPGRPVSGSETARTPGPGSYEMRTVRLKAGGKFGHDQRKAMSHSYSGVIPGPGSYRTQPDQFTAQQYLSRHMSSPKFSYDTKRNWVDSERKRSMHRWWPRGRVRDPDRTISGRCSAARARGRPSWVVGPALPPETVATPPGRAPTTPLMGGTAARPTASAPAPSASWRRRRSMCPDQERTPPLILGQATGLLRPTGGIISQR